MNRLQEDALKQLRRLVEEGYLVAETIKGVNVVYLKLERRR